MVITTVQNAIYSNQPDLNFNLTTKFPLNSVTHSKISRRSGRLKAVLYGKLALSISDVPLWRFQHREQLSLYNQLLLKDSGRSIFLRLVFVHSNAWEVLLALWMIWIKIKCHAEKIYQAQINSISLLVNIAILRVENAIWTK